MTSDTIKSVIFELSSYRIITFDHIDNSIERFEEEDSIWNDLNMIQDKEMLINWFLSLREYVWKSQNEYVIERENWDLEEEEYYQDRIQFLLGVNLFKIISTNQKINEFIEKMENNTISQDDYMGQIIVNDFEREKLFSNSSYNINIDNKKVSKDMIIQLANKICEEFKIKSLSFSYSIDDIDCLRYLFEIAYSFDDFSNIIKSKNIGFEQLSLCFEAANIPKSCYNTNYNTIYLNVKDGFGVFAHEWFHFIDHLMMKKYPFFDDGQMFFSMMKSNMCKNKDHELKMEIENYFNFEEKEYIKSIYVMKLMLKSLPVILSNLINTDFIHSKLFKEILKELDMLIFKIDKLNYKEESINFIWKDWVEKTNKKIEKLDPIVIRKWKGYVSLVQEVCFNKYNTPKNPMWYIYSKIYDLVNNRFYFSRYDEMLARSFEMFVYYKMMKKNWLSYGTYDLTYPKDVELENAVNWWNNNLDKFTSLIEK